MDVIIGGVVATGLCAFFDRLRGTDKFPALVSKIIYAAAALVLVAHPETAWWAAWAYLAIFVAGASYGWGRPLGLSLGGMNDPEMERWQKGILRDTELALVARGLMWLSPAIVLWPLTGNPMFAVSAVSMALAFVAAPHLAKRLPVDQRWAGMEYIRGGLFGALTYGVGLWLI